jgi:hypothetical protein
MKLLMKSAKILEYFIIQNHLKIIDASTTGDRLVRFGFLSDRFAEFVGVGCALTEDLWNSLRGG